MNSTNNIIKQIQSVDLGTFLTENKHTSPESFLLSNKKDTNELKRLLAEQLKIYPKASHKLPEFVKHHCWFTSKSYEQASSESSALLKKQLLAGKRLLDLSGGLGVDDWAFSFSFDEVISIDPDENINVLVRENFKKLGRRNIVRLNDKAEDYLNTDIGKFDLIYLDADRRPEALKLFFLDQCVPNFLEIKDSCFERSEKVVLKLSPMVDLTYLKNTLPYIEKIIVLGDRHEVKEVLVFLNKTHAGKIETSAYVLDGNGGFRCFSSNENPTIQLITGESENYFFEPHPCIIKAGLVEIYGNYCGLNQLSKLSAFYTGGKSDFNFIGRNFRILERFIFSKSGMKKFLTANSMVQANVTQRNFKMSVEEIRKEFKLKEGGDNYLFFTTDNNSNPLVFLCEKPD